MRHIHIYNPENDLALASGLRNYTAPLAARELRRAGELLPLWYCNAGDRIVCNGVNARWMERRLEAFAIDADVYGHRYESDMVADPWGWSPAIAAEYAERGFSPEALPSPSLLELLRRLSHRRTSVAVARRVQELMPDIAFPDPATEITDPALVDELARRYGAVFVKAPWSSSGRGVVSSAAVGVDRARRQAADFIRRQGSALVEPAADKAVDFARLFRISGGEVSALGTSVFTTNDAGAYTGNLLASETRRLERVGQHCDVSLLQRISRGLEQALAETVGAPLQAAGASSLLAPLIVGVDMLSDRSGAIRPVVEINVRKTMGFVANVFAERFMPEDAVGSLRVTVNPDLRAPDMFAADGARLTEGTLTLSPPTSRFAITANIDA